MTTTVNINGPPDGYDYATDLTDRQCKVAVYLYSYINQAADKFANTTTGNMLLTTLQSSIQNQAIVTAFAGEIAGFVASVAAGIAALLSIENPPLAAIAGLGGLTAGVWAERVIGKFTQDPVTIIGAQGAVAKLPAMKEAIICALSKTTDSAAAYDDYNAVLTRAEYGLSGPQQNFLSAVLPREQVAAMWYVPDWWPDFDTKVLSNIATQCCNGVVNGTAQLPSSTGGCRNAYYIVDELITTFNAIQEYYNTYFWPLGDGTVTIDSLDIYDAYHDAVVKQLPPYVDGLVLNQATSTNAFYTGVAQYIYQQLGGLIVNPLSFFDYNWSNLATYLSDNSAQVRQNLMESLDVGDAYAVISNLLFNWIEDQEPDNVDDDVQTYMEGVIDALIKPTDTRQGLLDILFHQVADLAYYKSTECANADPYVAGAAGTGECTAGAGTAVYDFTANQYNWEILTDGSTNASYQAGVGFHCQGSGTADAFLSIQQRVPHDVRAVKIYGTSNATWGGGFRAAAGPSAAGTPLPNSGYTAMPGGGAGGLISCCCNDGLLTVRAFRFETDAWITISKIEFINPD